MQVYAVATWNSLLTVFSTLASGQARCKHTRSDGASSGESAGTDTPHGDANVFYSLKTQMAYVRHEEDELEQKRDHCEQAKLN